MRKLLLILVLVICLLVSCQSGLGQIGVETATPQQESTTPDVIDTPISTPTVAPSPTPTQPVVILVLPADMDSQLSDRLKIIFEEQAAGTGAQLMLVESLNVAELGDEVVGVVMLSSDPALTSISQAPSEIKFLVLGNPEQQLDDRTVIVGGGNVSLDQSAFLAGYTLAVLTPDWRTGIILPSESTPEVAAVEQAFRNGVIFYCGLCRPSYPPFVAYPVVVSIHAGSGDAGIQAAVDGLINNGVVTVYLSPMIQDPNLITALANAGLNMIGSGQPPAGVEQNWVASIEADLVSMLGDVGSAWLTGDPISVQMVPVSIARPNPDLFSIGRQNLVAQLQDDLHNGYIDTGIENPNDGDSGEVQTP